MEPGITWVACYTSAFITRTTPQLGYNLIIHVCLHVYCIYVQPMYCMYIVLFATYIRANMNLQSVINCGHYDCHKCEVGRALIVCVYIYHTHAMISEVFPVR